jgi:hypothetical protein
MPRTKKGPIAPYRVPPHGGDPAKTLMTRAVKRHLVHTLTRTRTETKDGKKVKVPGHRSKTKAALRARTVTIVKQEKGEVALAHLHPGTLRNRLLSMLKPEGRAGARINLAELAKIKASGVLDRATAA